jgi:hypothetical protein
MSSMKTTRPSFSGKLASLVWAPVSRLSAPSDGPRPSDVTYVRSSEDMARAVRRQMVNEGKSFTKK